MAVLVVQHVAEEGPYEIGTSLGAAGLALRVCRVWAGDPLPEDLNGAEALVVLGGPMSAYSDDGFPTRTPLTAWRGLPSARRGGVAPPVSGTQGRLRMTEAGRSRPSSPTANGRLTEDDVPAHAAR